VRGGDLPVAAASAGAHCVIPESPGSLQIFTVASFFAENRFPLFRTML
jgi:hypothetical protein